MAISDFVSGRGWIIDSIIEGDYLRLRDCLYIATFGNQSVFLIFERDGATLVSGRARYAPNMNGGVVLGEISGTRYRLQFDGDGKLEIYYSSEGGGSSPNGGGTSSGPGGN